MQDDVQKMQAMTFFFVFTSDFSMRNLRVKQTRPETRSFGNPETGHRIFDGNTMKCHGTVARGGLPKSQSSVDGPPVGLRWIRSNQKIYDIH